MNHQTAYYLVNCSGRSICLPAEDILYLASAEEVTEKQQITCIRFSGQWYPVYGFNSNWIPASGLQPEEKKVILLKAAFGNTPAMALSCHSLFKLRTASKVYPIPSCMRKLSPIEGLIRQNSDWHLFATSLTITRFFEKVLSYGASESRSVAEHPPIQRSVGLAS
ncbi:hypothetical protein BTA51_16965 [Hahella sp. CCB-MM4]|uniref:hypothetical protein n=1 Tax=Hahella sp. (strain CCB-MM4) TaxID=1926491 RepID=UPI000B9B2E4E|nr:hypothetical protein [Hahella sp. CCB-MM4]OZG72063.1 hypothetical protein BTA51_16965 [Hahella sp. CCB-MM4]